jgi:hypothetical protein
LSDILSNLDLAKVGPRSGATRTLDSSIALEGMKVTEGEQVTYTTPTGDRPIFDYSQIKKTKAADGTVIDFQKYFHKKGYEAWPAWLYHPTEPPVLCKDQDEAAEFGVYYRETTEDEKARFGGLPATWDWMTDSLWRPSPYKGTQKPDVKAYGKELQVAAPNYLAQQNDLLRGLTAALSQNNNASSAQLQALMETFLAAMMKGQATQVAPAETAVQAPSEAPQSALSGEPMDERVFETPQAMEDADERDHWISEAERLGLKIDKRWTLKRIQDTVLKAV